MGVGVLKYMGSKRLLLLNGLGEEVLRQARLGTRFVDLFAGTGSVASHVAQRLPVEVLAVDLQSYAQVLTAAIITRTAILEPTVGQAWIAEAEASLESAKAGRRWNALPQDPDDVKAARRRCASNGGKLQRAYGGHYFSPWQAAALDSLIEALPTEEPERTVLLAAVIRTAARCAAAPGHTAQPFQPTESSMPHIRSAWAKNPFALAADAVDDLRDQRALIRGRAIVDDACAVVADLREGDVAFLDPPYSSAQYSRYYHVLETIARGGCGAVEGAGRYPPFDERPQSSFSKRSEATRALSGLLQALGERRCVAILTFPQFPASNGVVAEDLISLCREWFHVDVRAISSRFSTLGGNNELRASRRRSSELVLTLKPKTMVG